MGLLFDAATAWDNLQSTTYEMLLGRKETNFSLTLSFFPEDFAHLAGIQYATDVDFHLSRAELRGSKFLSNILGKQLDDSLIEKSADWLKIRGRLEGIVLLEFILDNDFQIASFDPRRAPHGSKIDAKFVIKSLVTDSTYFVFWDKNTKRWFCKSVFQLNVADYTYNQPRYTVLKKQKCKDGKLLTDYTHPHYKPLPTLDFFNKH